MEDSLLGAVPTDSQNSASSDVQNAEERPDKANEVGEEQMETEE